MVLKESFSSKKEMPHVTVKTITYNIHAFIGQFWTLWNKEHKIAQLIKENKYDFVCLQEAWDSSSSKIIQKKTGYIHSMHSQRPDCILSVYGNGLSTLTNWKILQEGYVFWKEKNWKQYEGKFGSHKGFSYAKIQHPEFEDCQIVVYNLHGLAGDKTMQDKVFKNFQQLGEHIAINFPDDAVLIGGDFNCRHRWRPLDARTNEGPIESHETYGTGLKRYDAFGVLQNISGVRDSEFLAKGTHEHLAAVDKWFVKDGRYVKIKVTGWNYLGAETKWHGLSDHHPQELEIDISF